MNFLVSFPDHVVITGLLAAALLATCVFHPGSKWLVAALAAVVTVALGFILVTYYGTFQMPYSNYTHYYLGAKYRLDYFDFYRVLRAARGEPLVRYRDLRDYTPRGIINNDERGEKAYYLDLLRRYGYPADPGLRADTLRALCTRAQLFERESKSILTRTGLDGGRIAQLEVDAKAGYIIFQDHGFNGSPFYILFKHLDPALYFPLSTASFRWSVVLELLLLGLAGLVVARTLKLDTAGLLLFLALLLTTWELMGWNLSGLVFMGWFFPLCLALYFIDRGAAIAAGVALAAAILLKIFPAMALLPFVVSLAIRQARARTFTLGGFEFRFLLATAVSVILLGAVASTQGDWTQWYEKIRLQFESQGASHNSVSFPSTWRLVAGHSDDYAVLRLRVLWVMRAVFLGGLVLLVKRLPMTASSLTLTVIFSLSMLPLITVDFPHYYTPGIGALVLVLLFMRARRYFVALALLLIVNQALLDYHEALRLGSLLWLKNAYFFLAPLVLYLCLWRGLPVPNASAES